MPNGMEYDNILYSLIEGFLDSTVVSKLVELYVEIFSDADTNFFKQRISEHPKL